MALCRGCNEEIAFVKMTTGKFHPVEGSEAGTHYVHLDQPGHPQIVLVTDDGTVIRGREGKATDSGVCKVEGRESHFASCSHADEFRR